MTDIARHRAPPALGSSGPLFAGILALLVVANALFAWQGWSVLLFLLNLVLIAAVIAIAGTVATGYASGALMSSRNRYSLSRLQMTGWTVVVMAGLVTVAAVRVFGKEPAKALDIWIDPHLLMAMGIAAFTTAATPTVLSLKRHETPSEGQMAAVRDKVDPEHPESVKNVGGLIARTSPDRARWLDLVSGDEVANAATVDLSKVQNLLITIILWGGFVGTLIRLLAAATPDAPIGALPELSEEALTLMAISHGGYLAFKATPKAGPAAEGAGAEPAPANRVGALPAAPPQPKAVAPAGASS